MDNMVIFALYLLLLVTWVLLPLIPAWITYRITPHQSLGLRGPLSGLTLSASGAFAAYLVVLLISNGIFNRGADILGSLARPAWTLVADLVVKDREGKTQQVPPGQSLVNVTFVPNIHNVFADRVQLRLPGNMSEWPHVLFDIPQYGGSRPLAFQEMTDRMKIDTFNKTIYLREPIVIQQAPAEGFGVGLRIGQR